MNLKNSIIVFFSTLTLTLNAQDKIFEKIENKTWYESDEFTGTSIVFYKTSNGLLKAIRQLNGSGLPVVASGIYDAEIKHDTIFLLNGLNLKTSEELRNYIYTFDNKTEQIKQLRLMRDKPILYTWTDKRKDVTTQIDVRLLSEILIEKNEIYKETDLIKTLLDK
jgi:hypothetical protein